MHCISVAILSRLSQFSSRQLAQIDLSVFCVKQPTNQSINQSKAMPRLPFTIQGLNLSICITSSLSIGHYWLIVVWTFAISLSVWLMFVNKYFSCYIHWSNNRGMSAVYSVTCLIRPLCVTSSLVSIGHYWSVVWAVFPVTCFIRPLCQRLTLQYRFSKHVFRYLQQF